MSRPGYGWPFRQTIQDKSARSRPSRRVGIAAIIHCRSCCYHRKAVRFDEQLEITGRRSELKSADYDR
jgi:hypothetical protein